MLAAMKRYAAMLRGVSPMNAKMADLKRAFELGGFSDVKTLLSSGNLVFSAKAASNAALQKQAEAAMQEHLGRTFTTFVRPIEALRAIVEAEPYAAVRLEPGEKRVVTFLLKKPASPPQLDLPIVFQAARIVAVSGSEVFCAYVPGPRGPVFMTLIERTFGKDVTTRTWDTVAKLIKAGDGV